MTFVVRMVAVVLALALLSGCPAATVEGMLSPEDRAYAQRYIDRLRERKYDEIEQAIDPSLKQGDMRATLVLMANLIPERSPDSIKVVGVNSNRIVDMALNANGNRNADVNYLNVTFEYAFPGQWLLINIATQAKGSGKTIVGFNVVPMGESAEERGRFTLAGKSPLHYAILAWGAASVLLTLYALVACARIPGLRRKWLWMIFIAVGVGALSINWHTGQAGFQPIYVMLFSFGAFAPENGPWTVTTSIPLGAIVFLLRRKRLAAKVAPPGDAIAG